MAAMLGTKGQGLRQLKRVGLPDATVQKLAMRNITTAKDLLVRTEVDVIETLDVHAERAGEVILCVSRAICPPVRSAHEIYAQALARDKFLATRLKALDAALRGGVQAGGISELVGPAGVGKTQLCMMLTAFATLPRRLGGLEGTVLYFDTENKFSSERLVEIARAHFPEHFALEGAARALTEAVMVIAPQSSGDLMHRLSGMESAVIDRGVKLVVLDSVAALARSEYGRDELVQRQDMLGRQAAALKFVAETFGIPAVVTNQVTTRFGGDGGGRAGGGGGGGGGENLDSYLTAALGTKWAHCVNTRLVLEKAAGHRVIRIAKSPICPDASFPYEVAAGGLELLEGTGAGEGAGPAGAPGGGSVVNMHIGNEAGYRGNERSGGYQW